MCKLCERDKKYIPDIVKQITYGVGENGQVAYISDDRLAVLERDHILLPALEERLEPLELLLIPLLQHDTDTIEDVLKRIIKDHLAMERLRLREATALWLSITPDGYKWATEWVDVGSAKISNDPADAILQVKEK